MAMRVVKAIFYLICLFCVVIFAKKTKYVLVTTGLECIQSSDIIKNVSCSVRAYNRTVKLMSLHMEFNKPIKKLYANINLYKKFASVYKHFVVNVTEDFCAFAKGRPSPALSILLRDARKYNFYNVSCPLQGKAGIRDYFPVIDSSFLDPFSVGNYRLEVRFITNGIVIFVVKMLGYYEPDPL